MKGYRRWKACVAYLLASVMILGVVLPGQAITIEAAGEAGVIFEASEVAIQQGEPVSPVDYGDALNALKSLAEGSITVRYKTTGTGIMSLFSVANSANANTHTHVYVSGSQIGHEVRNGSNVNTGSAAAPGANDGQIHTVTYTFSKSGTKAYYDGAKVFDKAQTGFISSSEGVDTVSLGKTVRPGSGNQYKFSGTIYWAEVRSDVLTEEEILSRQAPTVREKKEVELPDSAYRTKDQKLFYQGYQGSTSYRIPSLLTTSNGVVLAGIDKRQSGSYDEGNIDNIVRRSYDNGKTWTDGQVVFNQPEGESQCSLTIDPVMLEDAERGRIFMMVDMFAESRAAMGSELLEKGSGYKKVNGKDYCILRDYESKLDSTHNYTKTYTIREHGEVWLEGDNEADAVPTEYTVPEFHTGELFKNDKPAGNIFLYTGSKAGELKIVRNMRIWTAYSDDDGETWSDPVDLTPFYMEDWMIFAGVGPGVGIQLKYGEHKGRLLVPIYVANNVSGWGDAQASAVIYSDDHGETWDMCEISPLEAAGIDIANTAFSGQILTESQLVEMNDGTLIQFFRNRSGSLKYAFSDDGGTTWSPPKTDSKVPEVYCQLTAVHYPEKIDGKEAVIFANPSGPGGRNNGYIRIGLYDPAKREFDWKYSQQINQAPYAYSCLTVMQNGDIGLLYEEIVPDMKFTSVSLDWITAERMVLNTKPSITNVKLEEAQDQLTFTVDFDNYMFTLGTPVLNFTRNGQEKTAQYVSGNAGKQLVFRYEGDSSYETLSVTNVSASGDSEIGSASGELPDDAEFTFTEGGEAVCTCRVTGLGIRPETAVIPHGAENLTVSLEGVMKTSNCAREDHQFTPGYTFSLESPGETGAVLADGQMTVSSPGSVSIRVTGTLNGKSEEEVCVVAVTRAQEGEDVNQPPTAKDPVPVQQVDSLEGKSFTASDIAKDPENQQMTITRILSKPDAFVLAELKDGVITLYGSNEVETVMLVSVSDGVKSAVVTVPVTVTQAGSYDRADYLSNHDEYRGATQIGYGEIRVNRNPDNGKISLRDENREKVFFAKGYGAHCNSSVTFNFPKGHTYKEFKTNYGIDASQKVNAVITFEIQVDGKTVHTSAEKDSSSVMGFASVDIEGASTMILKATAKGGNGNGHSVWAGASLTGAPVEPVNAELLKRGIAEAKEYQEASYSQTSFAALKEAILLADAAIADKDMKQLDVFVLSKTLKEAIEGLQLRVPATGLTLNHEELELNTGDNRKIYAVLETASGKESTDTVKWTTNNEKAVTVSETGRVTAVAPGTAQITATAGNGKSASCKVIVDQCTCKPEITKFDGQNIVLGSKESQREIPMQAEARIDGTCQATVHGDTAITYTYEIEEGAQIAKITGNVLTVKEAGTVKVCATAAANGSTVSKTAEFKITREQDDTVYTLTFNGGSAVQGTAPAAIKGTVGTVVTLPNNTFTKSGYEFAGWSDGSQTFAAGTKYTIQKNTVFTAVWKQAVAPVTVPGKPAGLKAAVNKTNSIKISWKKVDQAAGYQVFRYNKAKKTWDMIKEVSGTSYVDKKLKIATAYQYKVKAYIKSGNQKRVSAFSAALKTSTITRKPKLSKQILEGNVAKLSWQKIKGSSGYAVEMKVGKGKYKPLKEQGSKADFIKKKISKGKLHVFRMRTYIKTGKGKVYSAYSKAVKIRIN